MVRNLLSVMTLATLVTVVWSAGPAIGAEPNSPVDGYDIHVQAPPHYPRPQDLGFSSVPYGSQRIMVRAIYNKDGWILSDRIERGVPQRTSAVYAALISAGCTVPFSVP